MGPAQPKRPTPPFFHWAIEQRKQPRFANVKPAEAAKLLKPEWAAVPAAQKEALDTKFKADLESYKRAMVEYDASPSKAAWLEKTGRMEQIRKAEAQVAKDAELKKKTMEKAKLAKSRLIAKQAAEKAKDKRVAEKAKLAEAARKVKVAAAKAADKEKVAKAKEKKAAEKDKERKAADKDKVIKAKAKEVEKKAAAKAKEKKAKLLAASRKKI